MSVLQLIFAPFGLLFAAAGWWMLRNARKAADMTIDFETKGPNKPTSWHGGETSRKFETASYKALGFWFLIGGTAFTIINLLFGFGVLTPASH